MDDVRDLELSMPMVYRIYHLPSLMQPPSMMIGLKFIDFCYFYGRFSVSAAATAAAVVSGSGR